MVQYFVNRNEQANGDHEVHRQGCSFMPNTENRTRLGEHGNCRTAVLAAKKIFPKSNGCFYCANECHTG